MFEYLDMAIAFAVVMLAVSLLITIFVQTASAASGLRGTNLRWGIEQLLRMVHAELGDHAGAIADRVLQHPIISDAATTRFARMTALPVLGRWVRRLHYANAIRVQELVGIMDVLAGATAAPATLAAATSDEERMAYIVAAIRRNVALHAPPGGDPAGGQAPVAALLTLVKGDLSSWFDTTMDRVSGRFAMHIRLWTVAFSVVVAFALHLDAFRLISQLAANPDARARLAGASDTLERVAAERLTPAPAAGGAGQPPPGAPPQAPPASGPAAPALRPPVLYQTVMTQQPDVPDAARASMPGFFADRVSAADWLRGALVAAGRSADDIEIAVATYQGSVDAALGANRSAHDADLGRLSDQALTVRGILNGTGFQLVPNPYHSWDVSPWWPTPVWAGIGLTTIANVIRNIFTVRPANLHFWGILFSAGLLGLGAPFWYNALKGLSGLKPVVASKADEARTGLTSSGGR